MKLISVIGGSGFIGTRLCRHLKQNATADFAIIDKTASSAFPWKIKIADIRSVEALRETIGRVYYEFKNS